MEEDNSTQKQSFAQALGNSLDYITTLGLIGGVTWVLCTRLARFHWVFDLVTHLQFHVLLATLLFFTHCLIRRRKRVAALASALILLLAIGTLTEFLPRSNDGTSYTSEIKVLTCNLLSSNSDYQGVKELIASVDPDFVVLLELNQAWQSELAELKQRFPHFTELPSEDNFGIAAFSKLPARFETRFLTDFKVPLIEAALGDGLGVTVLAAHPLPPIGKVYSRSRNAYLLELAELARTKSKCLVAGDLNVTPYSPYFTDLLAAAELNDSRKGFGMQPTWPSEFQWFGIPIDHILVSRGLTVLDRQVLEIPGSDHSAVMARLGDKKSTLTR